MLNLEDYIRDIPNFPKEGILFKDITPLLASHKATQACLEQLLALVGSQKIDKVVGVETRGFFFATLLADRLGAGFIPVRKPGKLPYSTLKQPYELEYGYDALEIHEDAIVKGEHVLVHDDVLATGGTARAVCELVTQLGGKVVQCNFIMQLHFLKGAAKLKPYEVTSVLNY
ncbi:MAG TPA: adenine phosphoribosyltransferase [Flavobacteriaceae bacterium]|nr:adenine phosphoribosyltransferase [Flavobacteriaceae bacterium]MCB9213633.1 adenine phosphoribosyltransferase [Alteromonas sp.]HPF12134.1 adenine phosphoribosyltransferase [Flavobacteriaceae bacterium]HQU22493.1 adenine phosphoribosyltransferase [Flavobacteriaceae bacterium]HQU65963.1 adenine phosphoribosyltransferase [Flavobacteriaceae bacterium]